MRSGRLSISIGIAVLVLPLHGCTRTVPVLLRYSLPPASHPRNGIVAACRGVSDRRENTGIDQVLVHPIADSVADVIRAEMASTGLFQDVLALQSDPAPSDEEVQQKGVRVLVDPTITRLEWEVPDYDCLQTQAVFVGFLGGLVGALIWGSTPTDVQGRAALTIKTTDFRSGAQMVKKYAGETQQRIAKLDCDTPKTRSWVAGLALEEAMGQFRTDLVSLLQSSSEPAHSPGVP